MDAPQTDSQGTIQGLRKRSKVGFFGRLLLQVIAAFVKFSLLFAVAILAVVGGLDIYDLIDPEQVPEPYWIGFCPERSMAHFNNSKWHNFSKDPNENWQKLQPSLRILRKVCPKAARWVEERHDCGLLVWETEMNGTYAHYSVTKKRLTLNEAMLTLNDGEKACTLGHEYRHSLQNRTKGMKMVIYSAITGKYENWIVERDAYDFERQIRIAIFT